MLANEQLDGNELIEEHSQAPSPERVRALRDDVRIAAAVHEAGHYVAAGLRRMQPEFLSLPSTRANEPGRRVIERNARLAFRRGQINQENAVDTFLGGYCDELGWLGIANELSDQKICVNANRGADDRLLPIDYFEFGQEAQIQSMRERGGGQASQAVIVIFREVGVQTYRRFCARG